jgi:hypothetical protein
MKLALDVWYEAWEGAREKEGCNLQVQGGVSPSVLEPVLCAESYEDGTGGVLVEYRAVPKENPRGG